MNKTIRITEYGAISDGSTINTAAIQAAIDACPEGGIVKVPAGVFCTGAIFLKSNMTLDLEKGAKLLGSPEIKDYPLMNYRWEGKETLCYASLINTKEGRGENISLIGEGVIDANGVQLFIKELKEQKGARGRAVCLRNVTGVVISGITIRQSPSWCLHLVYCNDVVIDGIEVHTKYNENGEIYQNLFNGDGLDIDSCSGVEVKNCLIASQDDCIAIKSGRNEEGRLVGIPTEDVRIHDCTFRYGFGVAIGSEMSGGIRNILVENCRFEDTYSFASVKAPRGRGNSVEGISYKNITHYNYKKEHKNCRWFRGSLYIDQFYGEEEFDAETAMEVTEGTAVIRDVSFENIETETIAGNGIYLCGLPEQPLENIRLQNVRVKALHGIKLRNVQGLTMDNVIQSM